MRAFFIRHGEKTPDAVGLTDNGMREAQSIRSHLPGNINWNTITAYAPLDTRSAHTVALVLQPGLTRNELDAATESYQQAGILQLDNAWKYTKFGPGDEVLADKYQAYYERGRLMDFYLTQSDSYLVGNPRLSTHTTMAKLVARRLAALPNDETIILAREFFWPNFKANIICRLLGKAAAHEYAHWYSDVAELAATARTNVYTFEHQGEECVLTDPHSALKIEASLLRDL